jgi:hypothetical protein
MPASSCTSLIGEDLDQPQVVVVKAAGAARDKTDQAADARLVMQRHYQHRVGSSAPSSHGRDLGRKGRDATAQGTANLEAAWAIGRQWRQVGIARGSHRNDWAQYAHVVDDEDMRFVMVDELADLVAHRRGDLVDRGKSGQSRGDALNALELARPARLCERPRSNDISVRQPARV